MRFLSHLPKHLSKARTWAVPIGIALVCAGIAVWQTHESAPAEGRSAVAKPVSQTAVPVDTTIVLRKDVPIFLAGLGTVQAFNTVTVKVRVDGELQKVAFVEGQDVKAGDLLAQIDPRPLQAQLDQAESKRVQDEALLANAKHDLARFTELAKREYATRQSLDTQVALVAQLEAAIRGDQAAIESARVQLGYTTILSPIDGRTGIRQIDQGNIVHATDQTGLVVITQLQPISVIVTLPEENLPDLTKAMAAGTVAVAVLSRDEKQQLDEGTLALIDNQIDQATGTIRLKATFPNRDHRLWPGQFINARLRLSTLQGVLTVPSTAVVRGAQGEFAYVVKPDNTIELRWLKLMNVGEDLAVVADGLAEGERVVTAGQYRLQPGAQVAARDVTATSESAPMATQSAAPLTR
ncbi:MAG TPA: efflux RND transporter periplasmic adaptor subunit [Alphaproteobacteria bacterium]|nr:efflux RND transporter periplasmic adaptor subunit [Alphaproteobacteria bacterium]